MKRNLLIPAILFVVLSGCSKVQNSKYINRKKTDQVSAEYAALVESVDGINLMPLLAKGKSLDARPIIFHYPHYTHATGPFSSIIENNWKLIRFYNDETGAYLLYNLLEDPEEQKNLGDVKPERRDSLARRLELLLKEMHAEMPIRNPDFEYSESKKGLYNLKSTKNLAERERHLFEKRLEEQKLKLIILLINMIVV